MAHRKFALGRLTLSLFFFSAPALAGSDCLTELLKQAKTIEFTGHTDPINYRVPFWTVAIEIEGKPTVAKAIVLGRLARSSSAHGATTTEAYTLLYDVDRKRFHEVSMPNSHSVVFGPARSLPPPGFFRRVVTPDLHFNSQIMAGHLLGNAGVTGRINQSSMKVSTAADALLGPFSFDASRTVQQAWLARHAELVNPNTVYREMFAQDTPHPFKDHRTETISLRTPEGRQQLRRTLAGDFLENPTEFLSGLDAFFSGTQSELPTSARSYKDVAMVSLTAAPPRVTKVVELSDEHRMGTYAPTYFTEEFTVAENSWIVLVGLIDLNGEAHSLAFDPRSGEYFLLPLTILEKSGSEAILFSPKPQEPRMWTPLDDGDFV